MELHRGKRIGPSEVSVWQGYTPPTKDPELSPSASAYPHLSILNADHVFAWGISQKPWGLGSHFCGTTSQDMPSCVNISEVITEAKGSQGSIYYTLINPTLVHYLNESSMYIWVERA